MTWDLSQGGPVENIEDLELCSTQAGMAYGYATPVILVDKETGDIWDIASVEHHPQHGLVLEMQLRE